MKKLLFLLISIVLLCSCTMSHKAQVIEALQVGGNYITKDNKYQLVFLDASSFAVLDSNEDAVSKGQYQIGTIGSKYYRIRTGHKTLFWVTYSNLLKKVIFPPTIELDGMTFYANDLMD